ncbi:phosphatase PAP2 family protein [Legionella waltersii]|uniref:undecaprenyl-diphosphate phosphatase n=1 Tax=Legionella waltersii TaxID=66969 RepID=A0A0W1ANM6_9GAMM|nr:phosphatase PAP2 family protein [Legionella waltersii]KTD82909.1 phosphatidylglycerophosphatase B [Legionella waltersii]SNV02216.1 phosphatidylglycerophosphatase B [Legionella waltersii]
MKQVEKLYQLTKKPWVIALYAIAVVMAYLFVDRQIATYFHQINSRDTLTALNYVTALGKWKISVALFFLGGLYFRFIQKNKCFEEGAWYMFGCVLLPNLLVLVAKIIVSRARPDLLFEQHLYGFYWFQLKDLYWSCPSGHAITVTALAMGLGYLFPRYLILYFLVAILVAATRVVLYHHYLSDVMIGFYLSVLVVGWFTQYVKSHHLLKRIN